MADIRKEQEREELHRTIWAIADELRSAVDERDFKSYDPRTMVYHYIGEQIILNSIFKALNNVT